MSHVSHVSHMNHVNTLMCDVASERAAVAEEARSWIGTPFHHAARIKGAGVDCAQLLLAVFIGCGLLAEPAIDPYPPQWFLHQDRERMLEIVAPACEKRPVGAAPAPGDIMLFRFGRSVSHAAIVVDAGDHMTAVHSFFARGVVEDECGPGSPLASRLVSTWTLRRWTEV